MHGDAYLRPDIFDAELRKIFHRGWVYVAHASEIPAPGDYRLAKIGRQSVIVTRGDEGEIHLLMNRCTHRANAVCIADRGNANVFRCSYHGWTCRNNGDTIVYSNFNLSELRRHRQRTIAGRSIHTLRMQDSHYLIARKKVLLFNNDEIIDNLTFLV